MVSMVMVYSLVLGVFIGVCVPATSQTFSGAFSPTTPSPERYSLSTTLSTLTRRSMETSSASTPSSETDGSVGSMPDDICNATHKDICAEQLNSKSEKVKCVEGMCRCASNHVFDNDTCLPICQDAPTSSILRWFKKVFSTPEKCSTRPPCSTATCAAKLKTEVERVKCGKYDNCICSEPYKLLEETCKLSGHDDDLPPNKMASSPEPGQETAGHFTTASTKRTEPEDESTEEMSKTGAESEPHLKSMEMDNPLTTMEQPSVGVQSTMDQPSTTSQTTMGEPSTTIQITMGEPSTTRQITMGEPSTTRQITMGEPSTTRQITMGEPSTTRQITMWEPSTMGHTTISQASTMGQSPTMTSTAPSNEDVKEAAPSNVDLVDAPKPGSSDKNSMQGDQPTEEMAAKPTVKASTGEVAGGATAESAPVPRAAAVGAPTPAPAPTTSTQVAPRLASESHTRVPASAPASSHTQRANQLGGGENGTSTLMASVFMLCLGLFSTLQLPSYT